MSKYDILLQDKKQSTPRLSYVELVKERSSILEKASSRFIANAKIGDIVLPSQKKILGTSIKLSVIHYETVYVEYDCSDKTEVGQAEFKGIHPRKWVEEKAQKQEDGSYRTVEGNYLQAQAYFACKIEGVGGVHIFVFKKSGWEKAIELMRALQEADSCTQKRVILTSCERSMKKGTKTYRWLDWDFSFGKDYFTADKGVVKVPTGEKDKLLLEGILEERNKWKESERKSLVALPSSASNIEDDDIPF